VTLRQARCCSKKGDPGEALFAVRQIRTLDGRGQTAEATAGDLAVRLAGGLCAVAADFGSKVHISQRLGVFVGAARESVNRRPRTWRRGGIADLQRGRILVRECLSSPRSPTTDLELARKRPGCRTGLTAMRATSG